MALGISKNRTEGGELNMVPPSSETIGIDHVCSGRRVEGEVGVVLGCLVTVRHNDSAHIESAEYGFAGERMPDSNFQCYQAVHDIRFRHVYFHRHHLHGSDGGLQESGDICVEFGGAQRHHLDFAGFTINSHIVLTPQDVRIRGRDVVG